MAASDPSSRVGPSVKSLKSADKKKITVLILVMFLLNPKPDSKINDMSNVLICFNIFRSSRSPISA